MKSSPPINADPDLFPGVRLDAHAVPELALTSTASLQIDRLALRADALVLESAFERGGAMRAAIGAEILTFGLQLRLWLILGGQLAHRDLLVCDVDVIAAELAERKWGGSYFESNQYWLISQRS